ncbi:hypothetical protein CK500_00850 [Halorubrum salipaludis]|uniref:DUF7124 domain-containing protein n=1 Tax=Halorubrum salipaludis TaxID=2032630 RepID=A0A2A2FIG8_9EURY|nr:MULTISPECIES: hypothetical protein [Halorubrum]PAU85246.1 hypothetical protein CK500_00850 [Halorubrum salipaludis]
MTERIDLDDIETDGDDDSRPDRDAWLQRSEDGDETGADSAGSGSPDTDSVAADSPDSDAADSDAADDSPSGAIPRVPRENDDKPAGVPTDRGGSGAGATVSEAPDDARPMGGGPHGGGTDEMTMALTYNALTALADPRLVVASAREWADWIGIVGDVSAPVITRFQRDHGVDADFFNGTGDGPAERLAEVDETSMFHAERLAVVGTPDDEWIAEAAGWEFVPLETAAEKAGWDLA